MNNDMQTEKAAADVSRNISFIVRELGWFSARIRMVLGIDPDQEFSLQNMPPADEKTHYGKFLTGWKADEMERMAIGLCFAQLYKPGTLGGFLALLQNPGHRQDVGGLFKEGSGRFYLTVRTLAFVMSGRDQEKYGYYSSSLTRRHRLFAEGILLTENPLGENSFLDYAVYLNDIYYATLLHGSLPLLDGESGFPAVQSKATHTLEDVVLDEETRKEIGEIHTFAEQMNELWALPDASMYRGNCVCIFTGEPGTGKSHSAVALGNEFGMPVYLVNTAQLVSKYIGETEKNLEKVLDRFDNKNCILFFDEAESIFSKRTEVKDAHDRYANQEQSFLLWKMTKFRGIIILATNVQDIRQYFDKAFLRRFYRIINIPFPNYPERKKLWEKSLGSSFRYEDGLTERLAKDFQLTGGSIYNIVSDGVIKALKEKTGVITYELLANALRSEFTKTGRKFEICTDEMVYQNPVRRFGPGYESRTMI
ncbi:MAG TPA: ATP-binding protein [Bacteroidia bacterium]|nr:ATP-binding protein [Bacteroidia bacterium]